MEGRQVGRSRAGKLVRGHPPEDSGRWRGGCVSGEEDVRACTHTQSTIPVRWELPVRAAQRERNAFGCRTLRMEERWCVNDNPGVGHYCVVASPPSPPLPNVLGSGSFVSRSPARREPNVVDRERAAQPGPASYDVVGVRMRECCVSSH
jgi:hypothetical protein